MTKAYYTQSADKIYPIYGANSIEEAKQYINGEEVIETEEAVYMNIYTGLVGFASDWENLDEMVQVEFDSDSESWIAAAFTTNN